MPQVEISIIAATFFEAINIFKAPITSVFVFKKCFYMYESRIYTIFDTI